MRDDDKRALLEYLRSGGMLVVWGQVERFLPAMPRGNSKTVGEQLRLIINTKTDSSYSTVSLKGDNEMGKSPTGGDVRVSGRKDASGKLPVWSLNDGPGDTDLSNILKDADHFFRRIGKLSTFKTNNSNLPIRAITLGLEFDRLSAEETQLLQGSFCVSLGRHNGGEAALRTICK